MAKLSAYGRTEVARALKVTAVEPKPEYPGDDPTIERKYHRRLMSDRTVLEKMQVTTQSGRKMDWGWKKVASLKLQSTIADWIALYSKLGYEATQTGSL